MRIGNNWTITITKALSAAALPFVVLLLSQISDAAAKIGLTIDINLLSNVIISALIGLVAGAMNWAKHR